MRMMFPAGCRAGLPHRPIQPRCHVRQVARAFVQGSRPKLCALFRLAADQGLAVCAVQPRGTSYAEGEGVLKDSSACAHVGSNIAGANGNARARKLRDSLERDMTSRGCSPAAATGLARECMASDYQDCEL